MPRPRCSPGQACREHAMAAGKGARKRSAGRGKAVRKTHRG